MFGMPYIHILISIVIFIELYSYIHFFLNYHKILITDYQISFRAGVGSEMTRGDREYETLMSVFLLFSTDEQDNFEICLTLSPIILFNFKLCRHILYSFYIVFDNIIL